MVFDLHQPGQVHCRQAHPMCELTLSQDQQKTLGDDTKTSRQTTTGEWETEYAERLDILSFG
jgi:hypothetical protein